MRTTTHWQKDLCIHNENCDAVTLNDQCTGCSEGYVLIHDNYSCVPLNCDEGYTIGSKDICTSNPNCISVNKNGICTSCEQDFYLSTVDYMCHEVVSTLKNWFDLNNVYWQKSINMMAYGNKYIQAQQICQRKQHSVLIT